MWYKTVKNRSNASHTPFNTYTISPLPRIAVYSTIRLYISSFPCLKKLMFHKSSHISRSMWTIDSSLAPPATPYTFNMYCNSSTIDVGEDCSM